ncbi:MAG: hypothetical protein BA874_00805 [Desulfuromonadales bacterium C00003068]|nr:MAG: hypothetical protein BA874_00805 [Desulfuromonadales bacterium C00003068]
MLKKFSTRWQQRDELRRRDLEQCDTFFFYGSLMERFHNFDRYIKKKVTSIEIGYCRGYLFNLPLGFPGLIVPEAPCSTLVAGEIMQFYQPLKMMKLLDRLESYLPDNEQKSVYLRRKMTLIKESPDDPTQRTMIDAWVYTYPEQHLSNEHHKEVRIECGQWKAFNRPANPKDELKTMFDRLSYCDDSQQIIVDPLLFNDPLFRRARKLHSCHALCQNRLSCGLNSQPTSRQIT